MGGKKGGRKKTREEGRDGKTVTQCSSFVFKRS
jgi:hypothetical protein